MNSSHQFPPKFKQPFNPSVVHYLHQLQVCCKSRSIRKPEELHANMTTSGFLRQSSSLFFRLVTMYASCGHMTYARLLFDDDSSLALKSTSASLWNVMIRGYVDNGTAKAALSLFSEMLSFRQPPDNLTFPFLLKACRDWSLHQAGVQMHGQAIGHGFESDTYVQNSLLAMYMNCGLNGTAGLVFDNMAERTVVSWNTIIAGNARNGCLGEALSAFGLMQQSGVEPDAATVVGILPVCAQFKDLRGGKQLHGFVIVRGYEWRLRVKNSLIDMYTKCGSLENGRTVFDHGERDVVSWTVMIGGYVLNNSPKAAFLLSYQMGHFAGIKPNSVTLVTLLSACLIGSDSLIHGKCIHGFALRRYAGHQMDVIVETALIGMYSECGQMKLSCEVFAKTSRRRTVPWNAIISAHVSNGLAREAIIFFKQMQTEAVECNVSTVISLLPAYAKSADLQQARNIHGHLIRSGFFYLSHSLEVATALVNVYSKCGSLDCARMIFHTLQKKDIVCWGAIISAYGMHGQGMEAVLLFDQMIESGVQPNRATFTAVLQACSHAGLVDDGIRLFKRMLEVYHMEAHVDHYTCIVDLLGRVGRLREAYGLIKRMPFEPNQAVWGALLGACTVYDNWERAEVAVEHLLELEPDNTRNYVLLGNIYAASGRWNEVEKVRRMMNSKGLSKSPGYSLFDVA